MIGLLTWERVAMPSLVLPDAPRWQMRMLQLVREAGIDWERTGALFGAVIAGGIIIRALFRPLWEKLVYTAISERCEKYDKSADLAEANADKIEALSAAVLQQGQALRDMPRLIHTTERLCETLTELDGTLKQMDADVRGLREFRSHIEGIQEAEDRRIRQVDTPHKRRRGDDA